MSTGSENSPTETPKPIREFTVEFHIADKQGNPLFESSKTVYGEYGGIATVAHTLSLILEEVCVSLRSKLSQIDG